MRWYVNDLSLQGQYATPVEFLEALAALIRQRYQAPLVSKALFCSRLLAQRPVVGSRVFHEVVAAHAQRDKKGLILAWVTTRGPFLEADRLQEADDYFEFESYDVTDQGLGEAARRVRVGELSGVYSFLGSDIDFERDPLNVQHGLSDDVLGYVQVANVWDATELTRRLLQALPEPESWSELVEIARAKYGSVWISDSAVDSLIRLTFYPAVAKRILELLRVLDEYMSDRDEDGKEGEHARYLYSQHFMGDTAWFSDESDQNKRDFERELSFPDPEKPNNLIFCPWHGKIQTPQFRLHFPWPPHREERRVKVLYIGPKITRH